jgi:hypothetical protein
MNILFYASRVLGLGAGLLLTTSLVSAGEQSPTPAQLSFFEKNIRPVLVKECYSCHSANAKKRRGGLSLDTAAGLRKGGETGPAIVAGEPAKSLLIKAIKHQREKLKMPPKKKLPEDVIADIEKWIAIGAPDPRDGAVKVAKGAIDIEKGRRFWSFQPPKKIAAPAVRDTGWPRGTIDRFLLAALEKKNLKPVADADPQTLIRRIYLDLIGLPPSPEEVEAYVKQSSSPGALAAVVDKLLASPRFGERWGRHWLDVARYAESSGRTANFAYPYAWRYRDYVIDSFNKDKPYNQFIREQLAGDLLPADSSRQKAEFLVATGFLALGPKAHDERNRRLFQMDLADEQIDATFQAFQGLTVACARCHDHKFDPIPQKDYYALAGIFRSSDTRYGTIRVFLNSHPSPLVDLPRDAGLPVPLEPLTEERRAAIEKQMKDLREQSREITGQNAFLRRIFLRDRITTLRNQLSQYDADSNPKAMAMGIREGRNISNSRLYVRGELDQPGETVPRGFPQVLTTKQPELGEGSGRQELGDWIASKDNPLTARVMVNRVWLHLFGRGLVPTPDNFGASGLPPSNPALLDHLAAHFIDEGWSVKKLIRTMVLSHAYSLSSRFETKNFEADPDNVLVWRMPKRRLEAEALRDAILAVSGRLDLTPPQGSAISRGGEGNVAFRFRGNPAGGDDAHRTVYLSIVRDRLPEMLTLFDFPDPSLITGERATTTVPAQALFMMNNPFVIRQAEALAERLLAGADDYPTKLKRAYLLCYSRHPSAKEIEKAEGFLAEYGKKHSKRQSWTALCQAFYASAEFIHR